MIWKLIVFVTPLLFFPLTAQAQDLTESIVSLHPALLPAMAIVWGIMKVADIFISEDKKAKWPALIRKIWDGLLLHIGKSRNAGSPDA